MLSWRFFCAQYTTPSARRINANWHEHCDMEDHASSKPSFASRSRASQSIIKRVVWQRALKKARLTLGAATTLPRAKAIRCFVFSATHATKAACTCLTYMQPAFEATLRMRQARGCVMKTLTLNPNRRPMACGLGQGPSIRGACPMGRAKPLGGSIGFWPRAWRWQAQLLSSAQPVFWQRPF